MRCDITRDNSAPAKEFTSTLVSHHSCLSLIKTSSEYKDTVTMSAIGHIIARVSSNENSSHLLPTPATTLALQTSKVPHSLEEATKPGRLRILCSPLLWHALTVRLILSDLFLLTAPTLSQKDMCIISEIDGHFSCWPVRLGYPPEFMTLRLSSLALVARNSSRHYSEAFSVMKAA